MVKFILKRIAALVAMLILLAALVFFLSELLPGNVAVQLLGPQATERQYAALNQQLGLDRPAVTRLLIWMWNFVQGNWGTSYNSKDPVFDLVMARLTNSMKLGGVAIAILIPVSLLGGVIAALNNGNWLDKFISVGGATLAVIPEFASGVVLMLVFSLYLRWFPISATPPSGSGFLKQIYYLILPAIPIVLVSFGYVARITRSNTIDVIAAPYVRTAYFKGMGRGPVITRHVLRNALPPSMTVALMQSSFVLSGVVVVEKLFTYPGLGSLLLDATTHHDIPVLEASVVCSGIVVMSMTLLADILHHLLNPRGRL